MITIIDYDMGNVGSIKNMLEYLGFTDVEVSCDRGRILESSHVILPGVGSFDEGMKGLEARGLDVILNEYANILKKPLLGICLGMQLLGTSSEEGSKKGLGLIDFHSIKFKLSSGLKVPHMGWNTIHVQNPNNPLTRELNDDFRYYFVHSYHAICNNNSQVLLTTNYGYDVVVGICNENVYGVQFHPEKSHHFGMKLLQNFIGIN
jgi:glutamine amidotransferase